LYDISFGNKIIEYNGNFWHANPTMYDETYVCPYARLSFNEIRNRDNNKINTAIANGYDVMIVWESDYKSNPEKIIKQCIEFLKT